MTDLKISVNNVKNPPEKVRLMYEAVVQLLKEQRNIGKIKVVDITSKAGIGKGTAYEYFSSKEELIANALVHEYSEKIIALVHKMEKSSSFSNQFYDILDWIKENREYNQMFSNLLQAAFGGADMCSTFSEGVSGNFGREAKKYLKNMIDTLLQKGFQEGLIRETNLEKRRLAFLSAIVEYAFIIMEPHKQKMFSLGEEEIRSFVYGFELMIIKGSCRSSLLCYKRVRQKELF